MKKIKHWFSSIVDWFAADDDGWSGIEIDAAIYAAVQSQKNCCKHCRGN